MKAVSCLSWDPGDAGDGPGDVHGTEQDFVGQAFLPSSSLNSFLITILILLLLG